MRCPACRKPLFVAERERLELDCCPGCRGIWFDGGEVELLAERLGLPVPDLAAERRPGVVHEVRVCPRCDRALGSLAMGTAEPVTIEACPVGHGLWFDHGELGALLRGAQQGEPGAARGAEPGAGEGRSPAAARAAALITFLGENLGTAAHVSRTTSSEGREE